MLRNIDPILSPELLRALRAMGHGDSVAIVDGNFPAEGLGPLCIRADGSDASEIVRAVLSVMPLDTFTEEPAICMEVVGDPTAVPAAVAGFQTVINSVADVPREIKSLERFAFYERAKGAFVVVQTGERRLYGNILLTKGVIG
jgi:L-fucose mutarotase